MTTRTRATRPARRCHKNAVNFFVLRGLMDA
jgi:hypothetical protein